MMMEELTNNGVHTISSMIPRPWSWDDEIKEVILYTETLLAQQKIPQEIPVRPRL